MKTKGPPSARAPLSVAVVVRDDADVLQATLESVRPIADEIVLLDAGAAAQTAAIGERCGATIIRRQWENDFSAARNHLLEQVTGEWVLWVEPGEWLLEPSRSQLRKFVDPDLDPNRVYSVMVEIPPAGPAGYPLGVAEQSAQYRLMPSRPDLWFEGRVRETLKPSIEAAGLGVDMAPGRITCHSGRKDPEYRARKARERLELAKLEWLQSERPEARTLLAMGEAAADLSDRPAARKAFSEAIRVAPRGSTEMLDAYYGLVTSFEGERAARRQTAVCVEALGIFPRDAQLLCALGNSLQAQSHLDLAVRAFETAVRFGEVNAETWHFGNVGEVAAACLSLSLQLLTRDGEAQSVLEEGLLRWPGSVRLGRRLVELHVKQGRLQDALRVADRLAIAPEDREPFRNMIRGACRAAQQDWAPALGYLQNAYLGGCDDPLCLRWLSVTLLSCGQGQAALPVLHLWQQREPNNREVQAYLAALEPKAPAAGPSAAPSVVASDTTRWHRIDPAGPVLVAPAWPIPIISQAASTD